MDNAGTTGKTFNLVVVGGGQAGCAAALAKETGVAIADVDTDVLRTTLRRNGAFVG